MEICQLIQYENLRKKLSSAKMSWLIQYGVNNHTQKYDNLLIKQSKTKMHDFLLHID